MHTLSSAYLLAPSNYRGRGPERFRLGVYGPRTRGGGDGI